MKALKTTVHYDVTAGRTHTEQTELSVMDEAMNTEHIVESNVVGIYPDYTFQMMEGYGCSLTESACYLLSKMDSATRKEALAQWFGPAGMDAWFVRVHIESCDYSLSEYQAVEDPLADPELETFSIDRDRQYILPMLKEAMAMAGHPIHVLLSPWSPPAQWKTPPEMTRNDASVYGGEEGDVIDLSKPGRCFGGRLKPEYYSSWARYLVRFISAYMAEGVPVTMLSIQNEAAAATSWDSCLWTGDQEREFLKHHLYPAMEEAGLTDAVKIFIWDHNKERAIEHIDEFMSDPEAAKEVGGFAYHWYSGDHFEALSMLRGKYPDKVLMHSESCGLHIPGKVTMLDMTDEQIEALPEGDYKTMVQTTTPNEMDFNDATAYAHDIIGDLNHGMQRWIDWNMIVDRQGGPRHTPGGFAAPIVAEDDGRYTLTISYRYIREIAQAIKPNAVVLGTSTYSRDIEAVSARNADGSIGVVLLNQAERDIPVNIRMGGLLVADVPLPARTLSTLVFTE